MSSKNNHENIKVEVVDDQPKSSKSKVETDTLTLKNLTRWLNDFFVQKCPPLTQKTKEVITKYLYIVDLVLIGLMIFTIIMVVFSALKIMSSLIFLFSFGLGTSLFSSFYSFILITTKATLGIFFGYKALDGLKQNTEAGWTNMYYFILVLLAGAILSFDFGGLFIGILSSAIALYLMFQVRSQYAGVVQQATK